MQRRRERMYASNFRLRHISLRGTLMPPLAAVRAAWTLLLITGATVEMSFWAEMRLRGHSPNGAPGSGSTVTMRDDMTSAADVILAPNGHIGHLHSPSSVLSIAGWSI